MNLTKIISGGRSGADQSALRAASALSIPTGGFAPKGWRTGEGSSPWLEEYGLIEWHNANYAERTDANIMNSDGTVIFGRRSPGSNRTEESCRIATKPCLWVPWPDKYTLMTVKEGWLAEDRDGFLA